MAENPATANDLSARSLRPLTPAEAQWAETKLDDAYGQLIGLRPSIETRLDAVPTDTRFRNLVIQIVCAMVLRVLNNPSGKLEESGDDYSYRLDSAVSTGALYASDAELALIDVGEPTASAAFTIRPAGNTIGYLPDQWTMLL